MKETECQRWYLLVIACVQTSTLATDRYQWPPSHWRLWYRSVPVVTYGRWWLSRATIGDQWSPQMPKKYLRTHALCSNILTRFWCYSCSYYLSAILAILLNSLVIYTCFRNWHSLVTCDYYILNLACSDIILPMCAFPLAISSSYRHHWIFGDVGRFIHIAVCFLWLSLPGDSRVTDEALLAETT